MKTRRPAEGSPVVPPSKPAAKAQPAAAAATSPAASSATWAAPAAAATSPAPAFAAHAAAAPATDLEGASHGYTSPTQVSCPFSAEEKVTLSKKIPCPALAGMFNAGMLKTEKDGTVKIPDLERALSQLGPNAITRKVLTNGADATDPVKGSFNLFKLNGSNLDHSGSTGIRQNGVHPERFDVLMSFSKDGERLTAKDLANAGEHFAKEDPGLRGRVTQLAEFSIVMEVFGRRAADGSRYFTKEDAKQLFVDGQIPSSWQPPAVPGKVGLTDVLGGTALGFFRQLVNGR
jgi:hypothetical protein